MNAELERERADRLAEDLKTTLAMQRIALNELQRREEEVRRLKLELDESRAMAGLLDEKARLQGQLLAQNGLMVPERPHQAQPPVWSVEEILAKEG